MLISLTALLKSFQSLPDPDRRTGLYMLLRFQISRVLAEKHAQVRTDLLASRADRSPLWNCRHRGDAAGRRSCSVQSRKIHNHPIAQSLLKCSFLPPRPSRHRNERRLSLSERIGLQPNGYPHSSVSKNKEHFTSRTAGDSAHLAVFLRSVFFEAVEAELLPTAPTAKEKIWQPSPNPRSRHQRPPIQKCIRGEATATGLPLRKSALAFSLEP
jgi:hypothetical protein